MPPSRAQSFRALLKGIAAARHLLLLRHLLLGRLPAALSSEPAEAHAERAEGHAEQAEVHTTGPLEQPWTPEVIRGGKGEGDAVSSGAEPPHQ